MVRLFENKDEMTHGDLVVEEHASGGRVEVYFVPPPLRLAECDIDPDEAEKYKTKLVDGYRFRKYHDFPHKHNGFAQEFSKAQIF